jgi:hypothetical protein
MSVSAETCKIVTPREGTAWLVSTCNLLAGRSSRFRPICLMPPSFAHGAERLIDRAGTKVVPKSLLYDRTHVTCAVHT